MPNTQAIWLGAGVFLWASVVAQNSRPREHFEHATVLYDWVTNDRGQRLRTFVTRPDKVGGKVPAIFFVGWLSCDTKVAGSNPARRTMIRKRAPASDLTPSDDVPLDSGS